MFHLIYITELLGDILFLVTMTSMLTRLRRRLGKCSRHDHVHSGLSNFLGELTFLIGCRVASPEVHSTLEL